MRKNNENGTEAQDSLGNRDLPEAYVQPRVAADEDYCDAFLSDDDSEPLPDADDFWLEKDLDQE